MPRHDAQERKTVTTDAKTRAAAAIAACKGDAHMACVQLASRVLELEAAYYATPKVVESVAADVRLISRRNALEEAAKVAEGLCQCDDVYKRMGRPGPDCNVHDAAAAIRALAPKPHVEDDNGG
jgi:hypothetical protein